MDNLLVFSETLFYLVASVTIIVVGVLCAVAAYHLIRITKEVEAISRNVHNASSQVQERIGNSIEKLSGLPILSFFLRRSRARMGSHKKGRGI